MKKALITGASSGIGKEMAMYLDSLGYKLYLVAREKTKLESVHKNIHNSETILMDLSTLENVKELSRLIEKEDIDILINNAGFGLFGSYNNTSLEKEMDMIDLNIKAVHILTKNFLKHNKDKENTHILNVASSAGLLPSGALMSTYYATKRYVVSYTLSMYEELRRTNSKTKISVLCPGPVNTNFNNVANVKFVLKGANASYVAKYAIDKMFKNKLIIIPKFSIKIGTFMTKFMSNKFAGKIIYNIQKSKEE